MAKNELGDVRECKGCLRLFRGTRESEVSSDLPIGRHTRGYHGMYWDVGNRWLHKSCKVWFQATNFGEDHQEDELVWGKQVQDLFTLVALLGMMHAPSDLRDCRACNRNPGVLACADEGEAGLNEAVEGFARARERAFLGSKVGWKEVIGIVREGYLDEAVQELGIDSSVGSGKRDKMAMISSGEWYATGGMQGSGGPISRVVAASRGRHRRCGRWEYPGFGMTPHTKKIGESGGAVNTKEFVDGGESKSKKKVEKSASSRWEMSREMLLSAEKKEPIWAKGRVERANHTPITKWRAAQDLLREKSQRGSQREGESRKKPRSTRCQPHHNVRGSFFSVFATPPLVKAFERRGNGEMSENWGVSALRSHGSDGRLTGV
ncbi:hypothetical protein B0H14DRAFT_2599125 [Mycena olivaceomarginata]|nr:hypothetical protein B0H14DRAFT_2599125 [Mycena olivaceomarginata]